MCSVSNEYEWKTVPYKRSRRRTLQPTSSVTSAQCDDEVDVDVLERRVKQAVADLKRSEFFQVVKKLLDPLLKVVEAVVCYGLGSPSSSPASIHQLALLSMIRRSLPCSIYDPVFGRADIQLFKRLNIDVIATNEKCCLELNLNTLLFMLHCDMWMYDNLLWANWSAANLCKLTIIGNSFKSMLERIPSRRMVQQSRYIFLSGEWGLFEEIALPTWEERDSIFNDTAIVTFPPPYTNCEFTREQTAPSV